MFSLIYLKTWLCWFSPFLGRMAVCEDIEVRPRSRIEAGFSYMILVF